MNLRCNVIKLLPYYMPWKIDFNLTACTFVIYFPISMVKMKCAVLLHQVLESSSPYRLHLSPSDFFLPMLA